MLAGQATAAARDRAGCALTSGRAKYTTTNSSAWRGRRSARRARAAGTSTLDAVSGGRAEVILGRGSSIDSFPLFRYDLADYEELFEEKSARHGFSLLLAIIGGPPARFASFSQLFRQALESLGRPALPVGVHSPGHVAAADEEAVEAFGPRYLEVIRHVSETRGFAIPTRESFMREIGPQEAPYVGSPETVVQKIARNLPMLGASRFDLKYGMGGLSHQALMTNIERYGTQVIPRVRELLA